MQSSLIFYIVQWKGENTQAQGKWAIVKTHSTQTSPNELDKSGDDNVIGQGRRMGSSPLPHVILSCHILVSLRDDNIYPTLLDLNEAGFTRPMKHQGWVWVLINQPVMGLGWVWVLCEPDPYILKLLNYPNLTFSILILS